MIAYFQQLEIMAFFSGYPLLYHFILSISGKPGIRTLFKKRLIKLLPITYAITATLYFGLQIRNLYPDISIKHLFTEVQSPLLVTWGMIAIFLWIPFFLKRPVISVLHSWVFFLLLLKDIVIQLLSDGDRDVIRNDMKVYFDSILLNSGIFILLLFVLLIISRIKTKSFI